MQTAERFVVKQSGGDVEAVQSRLGELADVELLADDLLLVTPHETNADGVAWWERIRDAVESAEWVAPVVVDGSGRSSYPTGAIAVRFATVPSAGELDELAAENGLHLLRRNKYVPEQAVFTPVEPRETFLPELVDRIAHRPEVQAAWPVTMSAYQRVDSR